MFQIIRGIAASCLGLLTASASVAAQDPATDFDREAYRQLGRIALERIVPVKLSLDWSNPTFASATDGHGRRFLFIGFPAMSDGNAAEVVFEICAASRWPGLVMSGAQSDLERSRADFLSIQGNPQADYPHACNEGRRED